MGGRRAGLVEDWGHVHVPYALAKKHPNAATDFEDEEVDARGLNLNIVSHDQVDGWS